VDQFQRLSDFPVYFSVTPVDVADDLALPPENELQLLRIAQEALSNVRKHAQAEHAWVQVEVQGGTFTLRIRDDGKGFAPKKARGNRKPRFGLSTMRERAEAIGAHFEIVSVPQQGTTVLVQLKR
jgi:signal transduction histidine kinase